MNSSINSNFDDLVVLNDSSDNHENIFSIFRDFQNSGSRPGTTFSGDRLISFISLETGDDEKSIQLANRMLELNLFFPKFRKTGFLLIGKNGRIQTQRILQVRTQDFLDISTEKKFGDQNRIEKQNFPENLF